MEFDIIQEYVFKLPESHGFGFEQLDHGGWRALGHSKFLEGRYYDIAFITYSEAVNSFNNTEGTPVRVVKYSRYLVKGKPIAIEVLRWKDIK